MSVVTRRPMERIDLHLKDIAIESKSEELSPILDCDTLCLAIFELQGEGACGVCPLKRVSNTKWICEKAITLKPKERSDLTVALLESEQLDDLDLWTFFAASELKSAGSTRSKTIKITKRMLDGGKKDSRTAIALSLHVQSISNSSAPVSANSELRNRVHSTAAPPAPARPRISSSLRLEDITVDFGKGYNQHLDAQGLLLVALEMPGNGGCECPLRMVSKESARCDDYIQMSATAEGVVVVIKSELSGDLECFCVTRQELDQVDFYRNEAEDLERCIKLRLQVVNQAHDAAWWATLADFAQLRYERSQNVEDLDLSVMARRNQLDLIPTNNLTARSIALAGLSRSLSARVISGKPWSPRDVDKNIEVFKQAVAVSPSHGQETVFALFGLTTSLHDRFEISDDPADIHEEIFYHRKSVSAAGSDPDLVGTASLKLVHGLYACGVKLASLEYLDEAIIAAKEYLTMFPDSSGRMGRYCRGTMLFLLFQATACKYEATGDKEYLREAASISEQAFAYQPLHGESELQAAIYGDLATYSENPEHCRIAEKSLRAAVAKGATNHDTLATFSFLLVRRSSQETNPSLLREAITVQERRNRMIPENHFLHASSLWVLGTILQKLLVATGSTNVFDRTLHCYAAAATAGTTTPHIRFQAAKAWAAFLPLVPAGLGPGIDLAPLDCAIESIRQLAGLGQTVEQRHTQLAGLSQFVLTASGHALALERNNKAVEWLERGRGLIWSQLSSLRTPLDDLRSRHPALATQLEIVCQKLENASTQSRRLDEQGQVMVSRISLQEEAATHARLARERDNLIETIRSTIPGFENFLQPQDSNTWLENLPETGPVVLLHISKTTTLSRAIILLPGLDEPMIIDLLNFSYEIAEKLRDKLRASLLHHRLLQRSCDQDIAGARGFRPARKGAGKKESPSQILQEVLCELWKSVVKPVLDGLALSRSQSPKTRIWWCPTGPLTFLPLHAAGIYQDTDKVETILDYAVSSYIPTVAMLTERVKNARIAPRHDDKVGLCMLILDGHSVKTKRLEGGDAVRRAGLDAMDNYSFIHLACHGTQDAQEPLKSGFALGDGMLDLSTIMKSNLKHADFAFLSACQTSTGDVKLSEESVHLAAGMLATGYRGVVGTMWSISDSHAPLVAESFYQEVIARSPELDGTKCLDGSQAAYALHHAIGELRKSVGDANVLDWAPYVHFGL
ncbi:hypothetical protein EST38_g2129 [Candolleomyces aberdarensis]|uniref:CHAT domain-containing protein n=1 Tax=Candolleomyces aberdarensis TaxID=2316362 RepID=A0A4Q2DWS8_9AGAR|nr:hypothetical protein EST38_g2129 [Candolleomyces aberdarensis]